MDRKRHKRSKLTMKKLRLPQNNNEAHHPVVVSAPQQTKKKNANLTTTTTILSFCCGGVSPPHLPSLDGVFAITTINERNFYYFVMDTAMLC